MGHATRLPTVLVGSRRCGVVSAGSPGRRDGWQPLSHGGQRGNIIREQGGVGDGERAGGSTSPSGLSGLYFWFLSSFHQFPVVLKWVGLGFFLVHIN